MQVSPRNAVIGAVILGVIGFSFGRFTAPIKTEIKKEVVTVVEYKEVKKEDKKLRKEIVEIIRPDGTKETKTILTEDTSTRTKTTKDEDTRVSESKTVESRSGTLRLSVLAGTDFSSLLQSKTGPVNYGLHVSRNFIGPVSLGVWGLNDSTVGVSVGLDL